MKTLTKLKINYQLEKKTPTFNIIIVNNKTDKILNSTLLGRSFVDWVSFACGNVSHRVVNSEGKVNLLECIKDKIDSKYDYTIVLLANLPLLTQKTIQEIIEYSSVKNVTLCKLPVGYVVKNKDFADKVLVDSVYSGNIDDFYLVVNKKQLNYAIDVLQERINAFHLSNGVEIKKPKSVYIEPMVDIAEGVIIYPNNSLKGNSKIGQNVILKENNVIEETKIGANCCISGSVITKSVVGDNVYISSFCEIDACLIGAETIIDKGCYIKNYNIKPQEKIRANTTLGDTNDSNSGAGESR